MSNDTWNYPCWVTRDQGPNYTRNNLGNLFELSGYLSPGTTLPFTDTITAIFSVLIRGGGWTSTDGATQGIASVGAQGLTDAAFRISTNDIKNPGGAVGINIVAWDNTFGYRHDIHLGDADGTSWCWLNRWYQVAVSMNAAGICYAVNGTTSPKNVVSTNSPGSVALNNGAERMWVCGPNAAFNQQQAAAIITEWPSMIFGASAYSSEYLDLTSAAVLNRIYDTDGNFKNPGQNGSLWFGDTYSANTPEFYFPDGTPIHQMGKDEQEWSSGQGTNGYSGCPGGLKKQYEAAAGDYLWAYANYVDAAASGDAWSEGDDVAISSGAVFVYHAALAVDGHSGLIHKDPFNESGTLTAATLKSSEPASDPDLWDYTDSSVGTKGTHYEFDTIGGNGRIQQFNPSSANDPYYKNNAVLEAGDTAMFAIINDLKLSGITGTGSTARIYLNLRNAAEDGGLYVTLNYYSIASATNWTYSGAAGNNNTGIALGTQQRLWVYYRPTGISIWGDNSSSPLYSGPAPAVGFGTTSRVSTISGYAANKAWAMELGYHMVGQLEF